jgi:hypothetical protein
MEPSWAPIGGEENEWIQVGNVARQCTRHSELFDREWGSSPTPGDGVDVTLHIMCCLKNPLGDDFYDVPGSPPQKEEGDEVDDVMQPPPQTAVVGMKEDVKGPSLESMGSIGTTLTALDKTIRDTYRPFWFDDADGWSGTTHDDGRRFCESIPNGSAGETFHLCPIKAVCPNGPHVDKPLAYQMDPFGGGEQWTPISNYANGWVFVGEASGGLATCQTYAESYQGDPSWGDDGSMPELKKNILCCQVESGYDEGTGDYLSAEADGASENSDQPDSSDPSVANTDLHPTWYSNEVGGWSGGTHIDALTFCVGNDEQLCPISEVCPDGPGKPPLEGAYFTDTASQQWVPVIDKTNQWLLIHSSDDIENPMLCLDYESLVGHEPSWGLDESEPGLKAHILCCAVRGGDVDDATAELESPVWTAPAMSVEDGGVPEMNAIWFRVEDGWYGGSHDDAVHFCSTKEVDRVSMELCPYRAYCPLGPGAPPNVGYDDDSSPFIDQWAPTSDGDNYWVMVGMLMEDNWTTQCLTHVQLDGSEPSWGHDGTNAEKKRHIMCCTPS